MKAKIIVASIIALFLISGSSWATDNILEVEQDGDTNRLTSDQSGEGNRIDFEQIGYSREGILQGTVHGGPSHSDVSQIGNANNVDGLQWGGSVSIKQWGDGNYIDHSSHMSQVSLSQDGDKNRLEVSAGTSTVNAIQRGTSNHASLHVRRNLITDLVGEDSQIDTFQRGEGNQLFVHADGPGDIVNTTQLGNFNSIDLEQKGDNSAFLQQTGDQNTINLKSLGIGDSAKINQEGSNNFLDSIQR